MLVQNAELTISLWTTFATACALFLILFLAVAKTTAASWLLVLELDSDIFLVVFASNGTPLRDAYASCKVGF